MAFDFTNQNPDDPNGLYSLDIRRTQPAWVNDDWSVVETDEAAARKKGAKNAVRLATAIANDGKTYDVIVSADGQPISVVGDTTGQDDDGSRRWKDKQAAAQRQQGSVREGDTRGPQTGQTREVYRNGQWVTEPNPLYQSGGTTTKPPIPPGGKSETEGTPLPGGGWDNTRPRQVIKDKDGNVIWSEELTGADLTAWRNNQQANQPTTAEEPVSGRPGWVQITTTQNGNKTTKFRGPDGNVVDTLPTEQKPVQAGDGSWGYWDQTGGTPKWTPIAGGPGGKKYSQVNQDPTSGKWWGLKPDGSGWEEIQGGPSTAAAVANAPMPKGAPRYVPDPTDPSGDFGLTAFDQQVRDAHEAGIISYAQGRQLVADAVESARVAESGYNNAQTRASTQRGQDITQRNQDLSEVQSRRTAANTGFDDLWKDVSGNARYLGAGGGDIASQAIFDALEARQAYARQAGGYTDVPQVPPVSPALGGGGMHTTTMHPDGTIQVSRPMPTSAPTAPPAVPGTPSPVGDTGAPPVPMAPPTFGGPNGGFMPPAQTAGPDAGPTIFDRGAPTSMTPSYFGGAQSATPAYLGGGALQWSPDNVVASLKEQGFTDQEIDEALRQHHAGYAA